MDFGLFYYCQGRGVPHDQAYAEMLDQITLAEVLGFGSGASHNGRFWRFPEVSRRRAEDISRPC